MISAAMPASAIARSAFPMQMASVSASLRQGITMVSSTVPLIPLRYDEDDARNAARLRSLIWARCSWIGFQARQMALQNRHVRAEVLGHRAEDFGLKALGPFLYSEMGAGQRLSFNENESDAKFPQRFWRILDLD